MKNALIVSPDIPGNRRKVAVTILEHNLPRKIEAYQRGDSCLWLSNQYIASLKKKNAILTFMGSKSPEARLSNDVVPTDDNVNSNYKQVAIARKVEIKFDPPFTSGGKFGLLNALRS
jgi:hypothetical protein